MRAFLRAHAPAGPALWLVVGRAVGFAATFAVPLVLVRYFDQTTFGTYKQLFLIYATVYGLAQFGVAESLYYFLPRHTAAAGRYAANAVGTLAVMGVVSAGLLVLAAPSIARGMANPELAATVPLLALFLALMLASAAFEIVLVARSRYKAAAWTYAVFDLARAACVVVPAMLLTSLRGVLFGIIGCAALRLAAMAWTFGRGLQLDLRPSAELWRSQWAYTLPFALAVGVEVLQSNLHLYVVAARFDAALFAVYAVGCLQIPLVDVLTTSSANVMMVKLAEDGVDRHSRAALALWHDTTRRLAMVIFPLVAFLAVMARDIIVVLFTSQYLASVPIFVLWTCTLVFAVPCVDAVLRAGAQTRFLFALNVARLAGVAVLVPLGLAMFGLPGAALAMLVSLALVRIAGTVRIARIMGADLRAVLPWRQLTTTAACALAAAVPVVWFARASTMPRGAVLASAAVIYAGAYAVLVLRLTRDAADAALVRALPNVAH
jgi:O-antigen/teichoic acid export membrane protein